MKPARVLAVAVEAGIPVFLWGPPGVGKTAVIQELGRRLGYHVEVVIASLHDPTDFSGLPVKSDGRCVFAPPEWAVRLAQAGRGLLFLDELSTAAPAVQAAALRLVHERVVGYLRLPESVRVVAAGNPPSATEAAWELTPPLANRFLHLEWRADLPSVVDYFLGGEGALHLALPEEGWEGRIPEKRRLVASFLSVRPGLLHDLRPGTGSGPWPSPRTWDLAARFLAAGEGVLTEDELLLGVSGLVGSGAAVEFFTFLRHLDLPSPEELLSGKKGLPKEADKLMAALLAVVSHVLEGGKGLDRAAELLAEAYEAGHADVALVAAKAFCRGIREKGLAAPPSLVRLAPLLRELLGV